MWQIEMVVTDSTENHGEIENSWSRWMHMSTKITDEVIVNAMAEDRAGLEFCLTLYFNRKKPKVVNKK